MAGTVAFPNEEKEEVNDALSDVVLSRIFSFLPGSETPGMRQLSRKCLEVTEKYYQNLNLPVLAVVNIQFEATGEATVSIITDRQWDLRKLKNCIQCTATHLIVYSQFQPAFYNFQRNFGIAPELWPLAGSTDSRLAVRVPVNSLEESVALLLDYLKRNVAIRQLIMTDQNTAGNKSIITENMYKIIESFGKSVSTCQVCPILHIDFSPEYVQIYQNMLKTYNGWICNLKEFSQNDAEAIKKMRSPWLYLERQPPAIIFFQMLASLLSNWINSKTDIICMNYRITSKHDWQEGIRYIDNGNYYDHFAVNGFFDAYIRHNPCPSSVVILRRVGGDMLYIAYKQGRLIMCGEKLRRNFGI